MTGKVKIELGLDGFSLTSKGTVRSAGYPDRDILVGLTQHGDHLDVMVIDAISGQNVPGASEVLGGLIERFVADLVGELVDLTTSPDWHVHVLEATGPEERIRPLAQPARVVH